MKNAMRDLIRRVFRYSPIYVNGDLYMERYRFLNLPHWLGGYGIRVHKILLSDSGRDLHDHPFDFVSIIVCGVGYTEYTEMGVRFYPQFSVIRRRAEDLHRLELSSPVWTLVFRGPRRRVWGFQTPNGWVEASKWMKYENEKLGFEAFRYVDSE